MLPVIDISPLLILENSSEHLESVASEIRAACIDYGFFYITGHGVLPSLETELENLSQQFFALPLETKMEITMKSGGRAWRGYFPIGEELTSGRPDLKEGLYFGKELSTGHELVDNKIPLHGKNLFLKSQTKFKETVLEWIETMTMLGQVVMSGIALSLGLEQDYFHKLYTADPLPLFRIFHYPRQEAPIVNGNLYGVGEHTDYGLLTILKQDNSGGLEVRSISNDLDWIAAPPIPGTFLCNIGDMLDRMSKGLYRSTPHRVKCPTTQNRLSYPFFFDPNYFAEVKPIPGLPFNSARGDDYLERWDKESVHRFQGTYGQYLLKKVSKVFPYLAEQESIE